jgi:hypothetical protein
MHPFPTANPNQWPNAAMIKKRAPIKEENSVGPVKQTIARISL